MSQTGTTLYTTAPPSACARFAPVRIIRLVLSFHASRSSPVQRTPHQRPTVAAHRRCTGLAPLHGTPQYYEAEHTQQSHFASTLSSGTLHGPLCHCTEDLQTRLYHDRAEWLSSTSTRPLDARLSRSVTRVPPITFTELTYPISTGPPLPNRAPPLHAGCYLSTPSRHRLLDFPARPPSGTHRTALALQRCLFTC